MRLPRVDALVVEREKIVDYLLNPAHRYEASKARFFTAFGFRTKEWETLAQKGKMGHSTSAPPSSQSMTVGAAPDTDTSACEREIDERVSGLYGLTREGIKLVEDSRPGAAG